MQYIVYRNFRGITMNGEKIALTKGSKCEELNGVIYYRMTPICRNSSQNAYDYFARNDDGMGLLRGQKIQQICNLLRSPDLSKDFCKEPKERVLKRTEYQRKLHVARWQKIWGTLSLMKFKRPEHKDFWIWNFAFYNADMKDLDSIYNLITEDIKICIG